MGNPATGTIGYGAPIDSWAVPLSTGILAYITAFGFFSSPASLIKKEITPLVVLIIFGMIFCWRGVLLPFIIGCSSCSFMIILVVFNVGLHATHKEKPVVDYSFEHYRGLAQPPAILNIKY